jgi:tRNA A-37 threonylcarbamoyl transferase component Bud32
MDVTDVGPYTRVKCPGCDDEVRVKMELGGYRLLRRLAIGGMSVIFVARDETLGRDVALKVLNEDYSKVEKRSRQFEREAELTAAVSHPNVVRVYTVGRAFDRFFIAMELVNGPSLEEVMAERGAIPESEVLPLALDVVAGLRAAKAAGLIHRDIKPGNILIDDSGTGKIVDFGLSLLTEDGSVTADEVWATPYYVPPEALEGEEEDFRSDMYALGASLYHALAGKAPIRTKEMRTAVLREEKRAVPPLDQVAPWLGAATVRAVTRAMEVNPAERFASYEEFRDALLDARSALEKEGEQTPVHGEARLQRRLRQRSHRMAWLVAAAVVLLASAAVVAFLMTKAGERRVRLVSGGDGIVVLPAEDNPSLSPEGAAEISAAYEAARNALMEEDYVVAEQEFLRVRGHPEAPAQTAAWAGFEAAVAAYLDGRPGDGRDQLRDLGRFLKDQHQEETGLGKRLRGAIHDLNTLSFVDESRVPRVLDNPFRATVFFSLALKTWEQGQMQRAVEWFERLAGAGPWPEADWMETYQELARRYVRDFERLTGAEHEAGDRSRPELAERMLRLNDLYASLETRGRAPFNVKVWQSDLARRMLELRDQQLDPEWRALRREVSGLMREARFSEAAERMKNLPVDGAMARDQREVLVWLADAASAFLQDLPRRLATDGKDAALMTRDGTKLGEVAGTGPEGIVVAEGGGSARWDGPNSPRPPSCTSTRNAWRGPARHSRKAAVSRRPRRSPNLAD